MTSREVAAAAVAESAPKGYLDGQALAGVFAWLRPNDLVWNYVVNNYLLGKDPPAFDILYWNQDAVRLAAGLRRDFVHLALENSFTHPGAADVLGTPVDLGAVTIDSCIVAGLKDHIVPWENAQRSAALLAGESRFVLSTSGDIQALVNPPSPESRSSHRLADAAVEDVEAWVAHETALTYSKCRHQFGRSLCSFQIVQDRLVRVLAEVTAMQLYCLQIGRLAKRGHLTDTIAGLAKLNNTRKAREVCAQARDMLGGNGLLLENHVIRHMADIEAIHTYEGTETMQTLIVGRDITGVGAFT